MLLKFKILQIMGLSNSFLPETINQEEDTIPSLFFLTKNQCRITH